MALANKTFVLHGFGVAKKKELSNLISENGGVVAFALGRTVCFFLLFCSFSLFVHFFDIF